MEPLSFRLRGKFVKYDPNTWRDQYDMTINVGLGTGDKQQQVAFFMQLAQLQAGLYQSPFGKTMIDAQKVYNTYAKIVELGGQKNIGDFIGNPEGKEMPPEQPNPQLQAEQAKMQQAMQAKQMEMQYKSQADELDRRLQAELAMVRQQAQQATDRARQELEAQKHYMKLSQEFELNAIREQFKNESNARDLQFQQWKAQLDAATKIKVADLGNNMNMPDIATMTATAEIGREVAP
jgi:hypothetical protein